MQEISSKKFVGILKDIWESRDRHICFILGAGASRSSGIRTGGELAAEWLAEIHNNSESEQDYQDFLVNNNIDEHAPGLSYPLIYDRRFGDDSDAGYERIDQEMDRGRAAYGYSVLAQMLAAKQHNIVITTNFDNLIEVALYTYTSKRPLVCGHESLAAFARHRVEHPLIVKIHRDALTAPMSTQEEVGKLKDAWKEVLNRIFGDGVIPVFIGYGGNDGSLMSYLKDITPKKVYWCERKGSEPNDAVCEFLSKDDRYLVRIDGFDELMSLLQAKLGLDVLTNEIIRLAAERAREYEETLEKITKQQAASPDEEAREAAQDIVKKGADAWWTWQARVGKAQTADEQNKIYQQAIKALPNSSELHNNYGWHLYDILKDYDAAERHYKKALELHPDYVLAHNNYAILLKNIHKDYDRAEQHYKKALELDPYFAMAQFNYAVFLHLVRKDADGAERHYKKVLELNPNYEKAHNNYAELLREMRKDYDSAKRHVMKSLELNPAYANAHDSFANLLKDMGEDYDKAEQHYKKALELNPNDVDFNCSYAIFLRDIRKDEAKAAEYFRKAEKASS